MVRLSLSKHLLHVLSAVLVRCFEIQQSLCEFLHVPIKALGLPLKLLLQVGDRNRREPRLLVSRLVMQCIVACFVHFTNTFVHYSIFRET